MTEDKYDYKTFFDKGFDAISNVLSGKGSDFPPFVAQMSEFAMAHQGINARKFFADPEIFVEGNLRASAELGFDVPDMIWDVYDIECEAVSRAQRVPKMAKIGQK